MAFINPIYLKQITHEIIIFIETEGDMKNEKLRIIENELVRFLKSNEPEVLALKGPWGVGKTYFLQQVVIPKFKNEHQLGMENYAYISLFGINSISDLKSEIFKNTQPSSDIGNKFNLGNLGRWFTDKIKFLKTDEIKDIKYLNNVVSLVNSITSFLIRDTVICIDDFERLGKDLSVKEVLGLVSYLKEQRNCKVVLIFNDFEFCPASAIDYKTYREKVIDVQLEFSPTSKEVGETALPSNNLLYNKIRHYAEILEINNIRILNKIKRLANIFIELTKNTLDEAVVSQVIQALVLYSYSFYARNEKIPHVKFLEKYNYWDIETHKDYPEWSALLQKYQYSHMDNLDKVIMRAVESGFFDLPALLTELEDQEAIKRKQKLEEKYNDAFRKFYTDYQTSDEEQVNRIITAYYECAKYVSIPGLDLLLESLEHVGQISKVNTIIDHYLSLHADGDVLKYSDSDPFNGRIKNAKLRTKMEGLKLLNTAVPTLKEVLIKFGPQQGWSNIEEEIIMDASENDYYNVIKTTIGHENADILSSIRSFFTSQDVNLRSAFEVAKKAIIKLAEESPLNHFKLKEYIQLGQTKSTE